MLKTVFKSPDTVKGLDNIAATVSQLRLQAENPDFSDIHFKEGQEMMIWGVVTYAIKPFRKHR